MYDCILRKEPKEQLYLSFFHITIGFFFFTWHQYTFTKYHDFFSVITTSLKEIENLIIITFHQLKSHCIERERVQFLSSEKRMEYIRKFPCGLLSFWTRWAWAMLVFHVNRIYLELMFTLSLSLSLSNNKKYIKIYIHSNNRVGVLILNKIK